MRWFGRQRRGGETRGDNWGHHDWQSAKYVRDWIEGDVTRDGERRPLIRQMLAHAPQSKDAALRVLDVGAGYGVLSDEALKLFPNAHVTLQDYSPHMLDHAKRRLAQYNSRVSYVIADFNELGWARGLGGPFDVAISGIAIHNLGDSELIARTYLELATVVKPGGVFLELDYTFGDRTVEDHADWLRAGGFEEVEIPWRDGPLAMFVATR